jgi:protein TonB
VKFLEMVAKKDEEVRAEEEPVKIEEIKNQTISDETRKGDENAAPVVAEPVIAEKVVEEPKVFNVVEQMPEYPGGDAELFKFIQNNIQYPSMERDNDIQGKVIVGFVVMEDGAIADVTIKRAVSPGLDKEASRVVRLLPKFKPGKQQGKAVRVNYVLPIVFKLAQ